MLRMDTWLTFLLENYPAYILGGDAADPSSVFRSFWNDYKHVEGDHPLFASNIPWDRAIPYQIHGDEGRGQNKIPFLVCSWQPVVGHRGLSYVNDTSRLVHVYL